VSPVPSFSEICFSFKYHYYRNTHLSRLETVFSPGFSTGNVCFLSRLLFNRDKCSFSSTKKTARQLRIREVASPNPKGDQNCNLKIKIHHHTEITQTSHQEAQDPVHNTEIDLIHITQRFITSIIKNEKKNHRAHVVARLAPCCPCAWPRPVAAAARRAAPAPVLAAARRPQPTPTRAAAAELSPAACA
jgi:hypothetical protein